MKTVGFTLRIPTKGIFLLDAALSMSFSPNDCCSRAYLWGCETQQRNFIITQLQVCRELASHPLLLPVILVEMHKNIIATECRKLWYRLVKIETQSGLTGAPLMGTDPHVGKHLTEDNIHSVTIGALGIVQIATAGQRHVKSLLPMISAVESSIVSINDLATSSTKTRTKTVGSILLEKLSFVKHQTQNLLADIEATQKRGEVQITAVKHIFNSSIWTPLI